VASKVNIKRATPTAATLLNLYDYINKTFQEKDLYYTKEELEKLKKEENYIFLERGKNGVNR
jgi:hypothetical protein